ncbi:MAG: PspC domain-containing protein [Candidatus Marinimicrobia bacterium]|nr:PspC domain-containing protein [Candidatus Neomarinimicrobiota bacterium]|tara:strand:- start:53518 stop:53697 length:180 start_codon:yes stop_codon:yes gene_type:complete
MKRLYRSKKNKKIAGICIGIGDYFDIDPIIIRLLFLVALFLGGGLIVYLIAWIIIPYKE